MTNAGSKVATRFYVYLEDYSFILAYAIYSLRRPSMARLVEVVIPSRTQVFHSDVSTMLLILA